MAIETQVMGWRPHSCMFRYVGDFFVINNHLHVNLVNPQMSQCIICRFDVFAQISTLHKHLIKYNKVNGIIPMTTHVQIAHSKLFALKQ